MASCDPQQKLKEVGNKQTFAAKQAIYQEMREKERTKLT